MSEMITRVLHIPLDKDMLLNEKSVQSAREHSAEYNIDETSLYDIINQIYKNEIIETP